MPRYILLSAAVLAAVLVWLNTAEPESQPGPAPGPSEIRVALSDDIRSSYPGVNRVSFSDDVLAHVVEPLVVHRNDLSIAPMAASHYSVSDDLKTFKFQLREGLRFHNGEPVLARHVKMNWEKILDPKTGFQCLPFYNGKMGAKIVSIEVQGERGIVFKLDRPSSVFLEKLAYIQCPVAVLHPSSWDSNGNWLKPIATGPYRFSEWKKGRYILLKKFSGYIPRQDQASGLAGKKIALVEQVRFMIISDLMATKAALVSGQVDLAGSLAPITALDLKQNKRVKAMPLAGLTRRALLIQTSDALLADPRLRRAIGHALDMKAFAEIASLGLAKPNASVIPIDTKHHTGPHLQGYTFDLNKARELLKQANYQGEEIVIKTTRVEQAYFDTAMISEAMLKKAGLNIKIEVMEMAALLGDYFEGNYQLMAFEYSPRLTAFMNYHTLIGDKKTNPNRWGDKKAQALLLQAAKSKPKDQQRIYDQIHQYMLDQAPVINIYNAPIIDVVSTRLQGYEPWSGSKPRLWNVSVNEE